MARYQILVRDSHVYVDRVEKLVDLTGIDPTIHAVDWNTVSNNGHVEYNDGKRNELITDFSPYQQYVDAWNTAPDPPAPPPPADPTTDPRLDLLPDTTNSIPELRAAINEIKEYLRGDPLGG
jgi:hypothetical protein